MRKTIPKEILHHWEKVSPVLDALGSDIRLNIILMFKPGQKINMRNISEQFDLSRTAIIYHINAMQEANILKVERSGKDTMISVNFNTIYTTAEKVITFINKYGKPENDRDDEK